MMAGFIPTPTINSGLQFRLGDFSCATEALDYAAQGDTGVNFYNALGKLVDALEYRVLRQRSLVAAQCLGSLELVRGARVALIAETGRDFLSLFYACQYAGLLACPFPYSATPGGRGAYVHQIGSMLAVAQAQLIIVPDGLLGVMAELAATLGVPLLGYSEVYALKRIEQIFPLSSHESAYIQFSSGSTAQPKGVEVSQQALVYNIEAILRNGLRMRCGDRAFSWLPLYHDMGLVGFSLAAMFAQCSVDYLSPLSFSKRPTLWLELMSANKTTVTYSPCFGYRLALKRLKGDEAIDLSSVRVAGVGGDMIRPEALSDFARRLAPSGFRLESFLPSYGMAEATLAVSISTSGCVPVASKPLNGPDRYFISCGKPLPGTELKIVDDHGALLPQGHVGHIRVRGPGLMNGYLHPQVVSPFDSEGYLETGDLGYLIDGLLTVTGRAKDMIIIRGRNIWPQDVEWCIEELDSITEGSVAALSIDGEEEEEMLVLIQTRPLPAEQMMSLKTKVGAVVSQRFGVGARIVLVPPRSLPLTSSGKLSRSQARRNYLNGLYSEFIREDL